MTGILGYEIVLPMGNFFYSHSYALSYGEPILITGMMGTYKVSDQVSVLAGVHQGLHPVC
ncbi:MAG: outer membrane beta-barrel protein [Pirellulales bacterium]